MCSEWKNRPVQPGFGSLAASSLGSMNGIALVLSVG
jgi:hypothetical protein